MSGIIGDYVPHFQQHPVDVAKENEIIEVEKRISPYTPHLAIKKTAADKALWERLLVVADKEFLDGINVESGEDLTTSCIVNFILMTIIFVGEERAREIMEPLAFSATVIVPVPQHLFPNGVAFHHLLSGTAVLEFNKQYAKNPNYTFSAEEAVASLYTLKKFVKSADEFRFKIGNLYSAKAGLEIYDYNRKVIDSLESEMNKNREKVTVEQSFIYHVNINLPHPIILLTGSFQEVLKAPYVIDHAFMFEQYYSEERNQVFTRMHQAWLGKLTYLDHCINMNYNDKDQGCYTQDELVSFFVNFRALYLCGEDPSADIERLEVLQAACFKVKKEYVSKPSEYFREDDGIFSGKSIRYITSRINPGDCLKHLSELISKYAR